MIVDTGLLLALMDRDDDHHRHAKALFALPEPKFVPEPVVVETDWMILRHLGVDHEIAFLRGLTEGVLIVEDPKRQDRQRAAELVAGYRDARIDYVDAIIVAIAERMKESRVATFDRRHFLMIKPRHVAAFELLP